VNLRPQRREDPEVNLTPLIDVVFLLLIFFMVSTTFQREAQLQVQLPEASNAPVEQPDEVLEITIDAEGRYFINEQQVVNASPQALRRAIRQTLGEGRKDMPVVIRADGRTPHQAVVTAMDVAARLGLLHVSLATVMPEEP